MCSYIRVCLCSHTRVCGRACLCSYIRVCVCVFIDVSVHARMFICVCLYVNSYMRVCACMCVRGNIRVCVCSHVHVCVHVCHQTQSERKSERDYNLQRRWGHKVWIKKWTKRPRSKRGTLSPKRGGKLISSVTTNQIEEPIRGYSIRAFEAIAPDLLGIAPDRCAV